MFGETVDFTGLRLLLRFFFSSRRRHTILVSDWSSDVCSSDLSPSDARASSTASVSVSSAAVELARASLGDLAGRRVLVVGAGKSGELTAQALASHGVEVVVLSRCPQKAAQLASGRGVGGGLEELARELALADVVLSATSAPQPVVSRGDLVAALRGRGDRPLLVIDLAVPRD